MPIYEYECQDCGHVFDTIQKISEEPLIQCPVCQHNALKKLISKSAFQLKGTGWYETDFKGSAKKTEKQSDQATADTEDKKVDSSSEKSSASISSSEKSETTKTKQE